MKKLTLIVFGMFVVLGLLAGPSQAALWDRGGGLIYDDVLNITWLQDANYAVTSGYDADGLMNWQQAQDWAAGLTFGGISGWRLPETFSNVFLPEDPNTGYTIPRYDVTGASSEMAYMYYINLGYTANPSQNPGDDPPWGAGTPGQFTDGNGDLVAFENLQSLAYWSSTPYIADPDHRAWYLHFHFGLENYDGKDQYLFAWAVHDGDVGNLVTPIPGAAWLFGSGLIGLVALRRKRA